MENAADCDVAVAGAGVAGLWCGALLARAGLRVLVFERAREPGGRARSWRDEATGLDVDIGPHVISNEHRNFLAMLDAVGTGDEVQWQPDPLVKLLDARGPVRIPSKRWLPPFHGLALVPHVATRLSLWDMLSHARLGWQAARASETSLRALDGEDALHWLTRVGVRPRAIDWVWRTSMLALLNVRLEECSAASVLRVARLLTGRSGVHFGFPRQGLSQLYVPGCTRIVREGGGDVLLGAEVRRLERTGAGINLELAGGRRVTARCCVLAVPPRELALLLAASGLTGLEGTLRAAASFEPAPYMSTFLWFDRPITRERFWGRVWSPDDLNTDFYDLSNIRPALQGGGSVIACNSVGPQVRPELGDAQVVEWTLREVADFAPEARAAGLKHSRVHRIPLAIPQPRPGTENLRPDVRTAVTGLVLAGDWCDTALPCSMESAARSGALAAEAVLGQLGRPAKLAIPAPETQGLVALLRRRDPERQAATRQ